MDPITFGRYVLLEVIAEGGMGRVYRAQLRQAAGFSKQVAIKRILRRLAESSELVERFADEARIACTLNHGNIVHVFDFGEIDGEYYLAMEYIDGPDLGTLLTEACRRHHPLPLPATIYIAAALCRGLGAAHRRTEQEEARPVVHRDVSPANVLISRHGQVKVADFGIAKAAERSARTRTGVLVGKCRYMAPEQAAGGPIDPRTDVFAAGSVLYEMICGRPLFAGTTSEEVLRNVLREPIKPPSFFRPGLPSELDRIVGRALERDPDARYVDGAAMARELEVLLHTTAPAYSQDDLASLVQLLTQEHVEAAAAASTVSATPASTVSNSPDQPPAIAPSPVQPTTRLDHDAPTALLAGNNGADKDEADRPVIAARATEQAGYERTTHPGVVVAPPGQRAGTVTPHVAQPVELRSTTYRPAKRWTKAVVVLALVFGATLGATAGLVGPAPRATVRTPAKLLDAKLTKLAVLDIRRYRPDNDPRGIRTLAVVVKVDPAGTLDRRTAGQLFALRSSDGNPVTPSFWQPLGNGRLLLGFEMRQDISDVANALWLRRGDGGKAWQRARIGPSPRAP